jgi:hypothetical protein
MAQGTTKGVPIDTDPLLTADSDLLVPSQKAVKTYAQPQLNGTGFVKATGTTISYDNSTYLTSVGTGVTNELTYWSGTNTIGSLATATYPSLTELSYVKGVTSSIQTQIGTKITDNSWVDYSATSTFTGWASFTTKKLQYKVLGANTLLVQFQVEGTSNANSASFTLPSPASSWGVQYFTAQSTNTSAIAVSLGFINASSSTVSLCVGINQATATTWSTTGAKNIRGQAIINI